MKNDVLDVLMYIFEHFQDQEFVVLDEANKLTDELNEIGFSNNDISSALTWIDGLVDMRESAESNEATATVAVTSTRIFSEPECKALSQQARGFIYHLEQLGVLDSITREIVIDRVMALDMVEVDLEQVQWIAMMVLFNLPGQESACAWFEHIDDHIH
ncbi:MAG: DUF494 domain-containing protein [Kangiellaceae bacterium]|jgi:Smg protein|nr:DUF494 domain-containing protein [Kangiellaceae bacterium]